MRLLLILNDKAGDDDRSDEIRQIIKSAGHRVMAASPDRQIGDITAAEVDLVVVAGGDGTVSRVAKRLVGQELPFTILPIGTANNLAHSLGITAEPRELVAGWEQGAIAPLDAAVIEHHKGRDMFFESAGLGLFTEAMCQAKSHEDSADKFSADERFDRDFRFMRRLAGSLPAWPCVIEADGETREAEVLLCEVMNTRQIGSRLVLAPEADPADGRLDLILVTEKERQLLVEFLEREPSDDHRPHLPVRQGKRFRLTSHAGRIHVGDEIEKLKVNPEPWTLDVQVQAGAVRVLVPNAVRR